MMEEIKGVSEIMKVLLDHCCSILFDAESVQILVEKVCEGVHCLDDCIGDDNKTLQKLQLLKVIILCCLYMYLHLRVGKYFNRT